MMPKEGSFTLSQSVQFDQARTVYSRFKQNVGAENIVLTGHSLGGALASFVSICDGARAYTVDGADGHIIDTAFWDAYPSIHAFSGTDTLNFINITDELNASGGADLIQAWNEGTYPMVTYKSPNAYNDAHVAKILRGPFGSHAALSFVSYDDKAGTFSLGEKVKEYSSIGQVTRSIKNLANMLLGSIAGGIVGGTTGVLGSAIGGIVGAEIGVRLGNSGWVVLGTSKRL